MLRPLPARRTLTIRFFSIRKKLLFGAMNCQCQALVQHMDHTGLSPNCFMTGLRIPGLKSCIKMAELHFKS